MAPRSLPVINSSHLPNHKTGLQYLNITANCLATSKGAPQDWEKSQRGGWGARGSFTSKGYVFVAWCSPVKLWPQNCCLRFKLMGKVYPAISPCCWHRVFVHIQISQTVARVRLRSDTTMMYRRTCLGISLTLKTHTRKTGEHPAKIVWWDPDDTVAFLLVPS